MTNKLDNRIINIIEEKMRLCEDAARHERQWISGRTNPSDREIRESENFISLMKERAYTLSLVLEDIHDIIGD